MKKILSCLLTLVVIVSMFAFPGSNAFASENVPNVEFTVEDVMALEKYISVDDEGLFVLNKVDAVEDGVSLKLLEGQQRYLDSLNLEVKEGKLKVNENLEIEVLDSKFNNNLTNGGISTLSSCGGVTTNPLTHWWGVSRKFNSCDASKFAGELAKVSGASAATALVGAWVPGLGAAGTISASYAAMFSADITIANSRNTGVVIGVTWVMIYTVESQ